MRHAVERILDRFARAPDRDVAGAVTDSLAPRMLLTFGVVPPPDVSGRQTIAIDDPRSTADRPSRTVDQFFASKIRWNIVISGKRRPGYFDLAIIGADYRLGERRRILSLLRATAHRRSVILLLRRLTGTPRRSIREAAEGVTARFRGLELVGAIARTPALLIGDLDRTDPPPSAARSLAVRTTGPALADFIARHRIDRIPVSALPTVVPDAPGDAGGLIEPPYREIGGTGISYSKRSGANQRSLGRWWGKDLALLPVALRRFDNGFYLPGNGQTEGSLFDADGAPVASSLLWELGFGPDLSEATLENPPTCVRAPGGRWHPISDARFLRSGEVRRGEFYHLGLLDGRFGHFLVENLPRAWALDWALSRDMRILVWGEVKPYHLAALSLLGVSADQFEMAEAGTVYERVYSPDAAFRMIGSVSPVAGSVWRRMSAAAFAETTFEPAPEPFLYLSRAGVRNRRLANEADLEAALRARGGRILRPETLPFDAQLRAVGTARAIVGGFGSQLHLSTFQRAGAHKLVIAGEQFLGPDETLISIAAGTNVAYYVEPVPPRRSKAARTAPWSIDLDRFTPAFDRWLEDIRASGAVSPNVQQAPHPASATAPPALT